ncbi:Major Facilitator Superfamily protein [Paraburkholderia steynii]|uniref:Major Facilitator Superfamily protein n=1 Tax=Paraburkholderia steynii TaxID=1245441 RepID=A0A7Z7FLJ5_9BURK|nr:MFS transporter [Paraburkholderia steynii]SDI57649.1 Major Facilitator Superfamily protein [Paraburkholderia steynii]
MNKPFETTRVRLVDETTWRYRGWEVAGDSMITWMFRPSTVAILSFGAFIHPIEMDSGWTRTQVAIAITIVCYVAMLILPLQGYLVDKFGPRKVILPCIPLFSVSIGMTYFIPPIPAVYYVAWLVTPTLAIGLFAGFHLRAASSRLDREFGMVFGVTNAGIGLGSAFLPLVLSSMINPHGWRFAYTTPAVTISLITFPVALLLILKIPNVKSEKFSTNLLANLTFNGIAETLQFMIPSGASLLLRIVKTALAVHKIPLLIHAGVSREHAAVA